MEDKSKREAFERYLNIVILAFEFQQNIVNIIGCNARSNISNNISHNAHIIALQELKKDGSNVDYLMEYVKSSLKDKC